MLLWVSISRPIKAGTCTVAGGWSGFANYQIVGKVMTVAGKVTAGYELNVYASDRLIFLGQNVKNTMWFDFEGAGSGTWTCKATGDSLYLTNNSQKQIWDANTAYVTFSFSVVLSQYSISQYEDVTVKTSETGSFVSSVPITKPIRCAIVLTKVSAFVRVFTADNKYYAVQLVDTMLNTPIANSKQTVRLFYQYSISQTAEVNGLRLTKVGKLVCAEMYCKSIKLNGSWDTYLIGELPSGFKPVYPNQIRQKVAVRDVDTNYSCAFWVNVNGLAYVANFGGTGLNGTYEMSVSCCWRTD